MLTRKQYGYLEGLISIAGNILLFAGKYWVGVQVMSIGIIADAWHTLSDSLSSFILLFGFKVADKPPDEKHPYGHGRAEIIASVIIGTILAVVAFNFLIESCQRFAARQSAAFTSMAYLVTIISILFKELMAQFAFWTARQTDSSLLRADAWHHRSDALSSLVVLSGIIVGRWFWWADSLLGFIMSILLFRITYLIMSGAISSLLGEKPSDNLITAINTLIQEKLGKNLEIHHLHYHSYGDHKELSFHIRLDADMKLQEAHRIADSIENLILQEMNIHTTIHIDPEKEPD